MGAIVSWLKVNEVDHVVGIRPWHIRAYLVSLQRRGLEDTTQHAHARGIKTWLRWLVGEGDPEASPMAEVAMPRLEKRIPPPFTRTAPRSPPAGPAAANLGRIHGYIARTRNEGHPELLGTQVTARTSPCFPLPRQLCQRLYDLILRQRHLLAVSAWGSFGGVINATASKLGRPQSPVRQPSRLITQTCASGRRQLSVMPLSLTEGLEAF